MSLRGSRSSMPSSRSSGSGRASLEAIQSRASPGSPWGAQFRNLLISGSDDVGCVDAGIVEDSCWRYRTADSAERRRLRQGLRSAFRPTEGSQDRSFRADHADRAIQRAVQRAVRQSVRASNVTSRADRSYASDARCSNANHANPSASRFGSTSAGVNGFGSSHATISGRHSDAGRSTG